MRHQTPPRFKLRFRTDRVAYWSDRYEVRLQETLLREIGPAARRRGHLTRSEFLAFCEWKSPRTKPRCGANSADYVREVSRVALAARSERLRIEALTLLDGVSFPTASAILHFCARGPYPIVDFRALWTLNCPVPAKYTFDLYGPYTAFFRSLLETTGAEPRSLDRALWQFSRERQPASSTPRKQA